MAYKLNAGKMEQQLQKNLILRNVQQLLEKQTKKGIEKYGTTVNPGDYTFVEWLEHLQQELVDAVVYCETLKFKYAHLKALEELGE